MRIFQEKFLISMAEHARAGARGHYDRVREFFENLDRMLRHLPGLIPISGIHRRLTTARLTSGKVDPNSRGPQYLNGSFSNPGEEAIDKTRGEELNNHGNLFNTSKCIGKSQFQENIAESVFESIR
jgi:hypothetical protein